MTIDRLSILQDRMGRSYQEQVWTVAVVGGVNGFVIGQATLLASVLGASAVIAGLSLIGFLALLFLWSRHAIYRHYDGLLRELISQGTDGRFFEFTRIQKLARDLVGWSGILLYSLITLAMTWASIAVIRNL